MVTEAGHKLLSVIAIPRIIKLTVKEQEMSSVILLIFNEAVLEELSPYKELLNEGVPSV